jgi:hypothetical protein
LGTIKLSLIKKFKQLKHPFKITDILLSWYSSNRGTLYYEKGW